MLWNQGFRRKEKVMSVSGISSSSFYNYGTQSVQSKMQQVQQEFQQLGQDLQSGNLSAAQSDFASLQQLGPQGSSSSSSSTSSTQSTNPVAQAFSQLSQDLQSGNLTAAQQDYTTIQQDLQSQGTQGHHHHHHHHESSESSSSSSEGNTVGQAFSQLGQALQSGNLSAAQQAYSTLQTDFQQFAQTQTSSAASSGTVSVSA
jgi:outer membrane protein assembly factor BamD (BamD/ComL family)